MSGAQQWWWRLRRTDGETTSRFLLHAELHRVAFLPRSSWWVFPSCLFGFVCLWVYPFFCSLGYLWVYWRRQRPAWRAYGFNFCKGCVCTWKGCVCMYMDVFVCGFLTSRGSILKWYYALDQVAFVVRTSGHTKMVLRPWDVFGARSTSGWKFRGSESDLFLRVWTAVQPWWNWRKSGRLRGSWTLPLWVRLRGGSSIWIKK